MISTKQIQIARENWIRASINLSFKIISPYFINVNEKIKEVFAYIPDYGSQNGTIISLISEPEFITDQEIIKWSKNNKFFYSFINIDCCLIYNEEYFKETLEDWRKFDQSHANRV